MTQSKELDLSGSVISKKRIKCKTVSYFGLTLEVKRWVSYITIDEDGLIRVFEVEPTIYKNEWIPSCEDTSSSWLGWLDSNKKFDWKETLQKV